MLIPFVGPAYTARSINADTQKAINCYLEYDDASPRAPIALYGTPGLTLRFTLPTGPVRGIIRGTRNLLWIVAGNFVYLVNSSFTVTTLGTISTYIGPVSFAGGTNQILLVDGVAGYSVDEVGVYPIADPDFPNGVTSATFIDQVFVVTGNGTGLFYESNVNDLTGWDPLGFSSAEGNYDNAVGCIADHGDLFIFGENTTEPWTNTADGFQRSTNAYIETGTASAATIVKLDNSLYWLGLDARGFGIVWRMNGYNPVRVSNHAVETAIQNYPTTSDAIGYSFQLEGHSFYALTFPTADRTWLHDVSTNQWYEWLWRDPDLNTLHRHRSNCHVVFNEDHLVGDWENGNVYALDMDNYTDNGNPILRQRTTQTLQKEQRYQFFSSLQVDMQTGVGITSGQGSNPKLMLRFSDDGGHSWSNIKETTIGRTGQYSARARFTRLGKGRNRVWEITMTDPVKFAVFGAYCDYKVGDY